MKLKQYTVQMLAFADGFASSSGPEQVQATGYKKAIRAFNTEMWGPEAPLDPGELYAVYDNVVGTQRLYRVVSDEQIERVA